MYNDYASMLIQQLNTAFVKLMDELVDLCHFIWQMTLCCQSQPKEFHAQITELTNISISGHGGRVL